MCIAASVAQLVRAYDSYSISTESKIHHKVASSTLAGGFVFLESDCTHIYIFILKWRLSLRQDDRSWQNDPNPRHDIFVDSMGSNLV